MTVDVDPEIQASYDRVRAEHRAAGTAIARQLRARLEEIAERAQATYDELDELDADEPSPSALRLEDNDLSARAVDYQEPGDDPEPVPPPRPALARRRPADEDDRDDEVPSFRWDEV